MSNSNLDNPTTKYYHEAYPKQEQPAPALQREMKPIPDCGETSCKYPLK